MPSESRNRRSGLYIVGGEKGDALAALDPDILSNTDPVWQKDVQRFGPWTKEAGTDWPADLRPLWRASGYTGSASVFITGRCGSTMDVAREMIQLRCLKPWDSVMAVEQSVGRGQKQRHWISPPGNIYASWFWPSIDAAKRPPVAVWKSLTSLLAGYVMASGLEDKGLAVRIKWPNDLIIDDRKFCGLLVEDRGGSLIVGAGINLVSAPEDRHLRDDFVLSARGLNALLPEATPLSLWLYLMNYAQQRIEDLTDVLSPEEFIRVLERRMAWIGQKVRVRKGEAPPFEAVFTGLAADGGLRVRRGTAVETLYTGSILPFVS